MLLGGDLSLQSSSWGTCWEAGEWERLGAGLPLVPWAAFLWGARGTDVGCSLGHPQSKTLWPSHGFDTNEMGSPFEFRIGFQALRC